jgi:hypothetical protein
MQAMYTVIKPAQLAVGHILMIYSSAQYCKIPHEVVSIVDGTVTMLALEGKRQGQTMTRALLPAYGEYAVYDRNVLIEKGV